jgi:filamentous hemagglutinin family protein
MKGIAFRLPVGCLLVCSMAPVTAWSATLPEAGNLVAGQVTINSDGQIMTIDQTTQNAIIDWQSFSVGADGVVNIQQLGADSALLNRVSGADPSSLLGQISANGQVFLINPNGIVIGENATIDTASFIASVLDVADADFLDGGELSFGGESGAGVVNLGTIKAANGDVVLIATTIANSGSLSAENGNVTLAAGSEVVLSDEGNQRVIVRRDAGDFVADTAIDNNGLIEAAEVAMLAAGGDVYDLAINQSGVVRATGVANKNGRILLMADAGDIQVSGDLSAHNRDASGGEILVGGGQHGTDDSMANAANITVTEEALLDVSSSVGDAGSVVLWADERTEFAGTVQATASNGDGGFVEVSAADRLNFTGSVKLASESGDNGTLLLDPDALTIQASNPGDNVLLVSTLEAQLEQGNVVLDTSTVNYAADSENGVIRVSDSVSWSSGNSLTLNAGNSIYIDADLNGTGADIDLELGYVEEFSFYDEQSAELVVDSAATLTAGTLTIGRNDSAALIGSNSVDGPVGAINIAGQLDVDTLDLQLPVASRSFSGLGVAGDVVINNANNRIGVLSSSGDDIRIGGALELVNGSGSLNIDGSFTANNGMLVVTGDDLTLQAGTRLATGYGRDIYLVSQSGSFINQASGSAVLPGDEGRYLVYSNNPDETVTGGLLAAPVYNRRYADNAPETISESGNRILYGLAPTLVLTATSLSIAEGDSVPTLTYTVSGLAGDDALVDVFSGTPMLSTSANNDSAIGEYTIRIDAGSVVLSDYGYQLELETGTLKIEIDPARLLTITADDVLRLYGDNNPEFTASISGLRDGDDESVVTNLSFTTVATPYSPVGHYNITPYGASAENYSLNYVPGTLTVDYRPLTIAANSSGKLFGETISDWDYSVTGLASFDSEASLGEIVVSSDGFYSLANVGDYAVTVSGVTNPNYAVSYESGSLQVEPAELVITVEDSSRIYGDNNPTFRWDMDGLVSGDHIDTSGLNLTTSATASSDVGEYTISASGLVDSNYTIHYFDGTLTVNPATLTLTANDIERDYGSANPDLTYSLGGLKLDDQFDDVLAGASASTAALQSDNVGNYAIRVGAELINDNYQLELVDGTLRINRVDLDLYLEQASRVYGESNPELELTAIGLVNGDTVDVLQNVSTQILANEYSPTGTYTIRLLNADASNYSIRSLNNSTLTITPRSLVISADSYSREYGDANPDFTASFDGLASFDDESVITGLTFTTPADESSGVMDWGIQVSSDANTNYNIAYEPGTLTITPATIQIVMNDTDRLYYDVNPELMYTYMGGLKNDEDFSVLNFSTSTDASLTSDVGTYNISGTINNGKYLLDITNANLEVRARPLYVNVTDQYRIYGEDNDSIEYSANGFVRAEHGDWLTVSNSATAQSDVGTYAFEATLDSNNYYLAGVTGDLVIDQRQIAIKPTNVVRYYGDDDPEITYLIAGDGLASFDTIDDLVVVDGLQYSGSYGVTADVGARTTLAQLTNNANYAVANRQGYYVILPRPVTLSVDDVDAYGNQLLPEFSYSVDNLAGFDYADDVFSNLEYYVYWSDEAAPLQANAYTTDTFDMPEAFRDAVFFETYDSSRTDVVYESETIGTQVIPVEISDFIGGSEVPHYTIPLDGSTVASTLFGDVAAVQYIQARASNPNYVVVGSENGKLSWRPDPEMVALREEIERQQTIYNDLKDSFWNEGGVQADNAFGMPSEALPSIIAVIRNGLATGNTELEAAMRRAALEARGGVATNYLEGGEYSDFDIYAFLEQAKTTPEYASLLGEMMSRYVVSLISLDQSELGAADLAMINYMNGHIKDATEGIGAVAQAKYEAWEAEDEAFHSETSMTALFGKEIPYGDFLTDGATEYYENSLAAQMAALDTGLVAGGALMVASVKVMMDVGAWVLPFTIKAGMTGIYAPGGSLAAMGGSIGVAAVPAAAIAIVTTVSIVRVMQIVDETTQREIFELITDPNMDMSLRDLAQKDENGEDNVLNQVILATAMTSMFSNF